MKYFNQESKRLIFRKLTRSDIPGWVEFFENNDRLHFLGMDLTKSKEFLAEDWILRQLDRYEQQGLGFLAVIDKQSGNLIGLGGILPRELNGNDEYEIAYSLKPKYWGNGYATEIAIQMKNFGFKNMNTMRFISIIDIDNKDSANVAVKNGMSILFNMEYLGTEVNVFGIEAPANEN